MSPSNMVYSPGPKFCAAEVSRGGNEGRDCEIDDAAVIKGEVVSDLAERCSLDIGIGISLPRSSMLLAL